MSCDWQVGSIPLVECLWDGRNIASLTLALVMLALSLNCVTRLQVSTHSQISSCQDNRWDFPVFDHMKAFTHAVSHPAVLSFHQFSTTHRHSNQWKIAATVNECKSLTSREADVCPWANAHVPHADCAWSEMFIYQVFQFLRRLFLLISILQILWGTYADGEIHKSFSYAI